MAKLMVIGALAMDRPVRLSAPLAPGARLSGVTLGAQLVGRLGGGGANAGVALLTAGHHVAVAAVVAGDGEGDETIAAARATGLDVEHVVRRPGVSRKTLIFVDPRGERTVIGLDLDHGALTPEFPSPPPGLALDGLFVRAGYLGAEAWTQACNGPVVAHYPSGFAGPADLLVGSADDLDAAFLADPYHAAAARFGGRLRWVVVTHAGAGASAHGKDATVTVAAPPAAVVDTTGAGDIFAAGLLDALVAGAGIEAALAHACGWGAIAVGLDASAPIGATFPAFSRASP